MGAFVDIDAIVKSNKNIRKHIREYRRHCTARKEMVLGIFIHYVCVVVVGLTPNVMQLCKAFVKVSWCWTNIMFIYENDM